MEVQKSHIETALSVARDLAFVASIFLIFVGVVYREKFFANLNLPTSLADASLYLILVDAYRVLVDPHHPTVILEWLIVALALMGIVLYACVRKGVSSESRRTVLGVMVAFFVILAFPGLSTLAIDSANNQVYRARNQGLLEARVHIKHERSALFPSQILLDSSRISVLVQASDNLYVIDQHPPTKRYPQANPDATLYSIPVSAVDYVDYSLSFTGTQP